MGGKKDQERLLIVEEGPRERNGKAERKKGKGYVCKERLTEGIR